MGYVVRRTIMALFGVLWVLAVVSCGANGNEPSQATATPSEEQARMIAENMLDAYNAGDYDAFSRDWSSAMKLVIGEDAFREFRDEALPVTGRFVKVTSVSLVSGEDDRHPSFDVEAEFEKRDALLFMMTLSSENKVEELEFKPQS
jgi:hypothetical protein